MNRVAWLVALLLAACTSFADDPTDDPIDDADASFGGDGKADLGRCVPSAISDDARGVLALANDPATDADTLDAIGLHARTAMAITRARPLADLAALDAVPTVGPVACAVLQREACDVRGWCEARLSMWSWNIEHFPLSPVAVDRVADTLVREDAELVGFQEVDDLGAFDELIGKLPGWGAVVGTTGFETRVAIGYRTERLTPTATEHLFVGDTERFPRAPLAVTFDIAGRVGAGTLTFVVVHLKAMTDDVSRERRRQAIVALEAWLAERRAAGQRVIVVGDFNDDIDAPRYRNVFLPLLDREDAYAPTTLEVAQRGGYSYIPFRRLIDHVVMTREAADAFPLLAVDPILLDQTMPDYATAVSDHRPVRAEVVPLVPAS